MVKSIEQITLKDGNAYNCELISAYGHESHKRGIYLGKVFGAKNQLHGFVFPGKYLHVIKASQVEMNGNKLTIRSPIGVYNSTIEQERDYKLKIGRVGL